MLKCSLVKSYRVMIKIDLRHKQKLYQAEIRVRFKDIKQCGETQKGASFIMLGQLFFLSCNRSNFSFEVQIKKSSPRVFLPLFSVRQLRNGNDINHNNIDAKLEHCK